MDEKLIKIIEGLQPQMIQTLQKWIRIPSVKAAAAPGAPFGPEVRRALDTALSDAQAMGFKVRAFDGYAGDIDLGEGDDPLGILCHLDVVPAGDGWQVDPFSAVIDGDRMYGRGTSDDKGPAVAALYAMKAIRDAGVPLKRNVRLILGCDEESGWACMAHYEKQTKMPEMGFSPDASFPVINTEKGGLHLSYAAPAAKDGLQVVAFNTGERMNVIPGVAEATVRGGADIVDRVTAFCKETGLNLTAHDADGLITIRSTGVPGHAAYPESAKNAIGQMLLCLKALGVKGPLYELADKVGMEYNCESLGCYVQDKLSGPITLNMGIIRADEKAVSGTFDIRYPVMANPERITEAIRAALKGLEITVGSQRTPHHVPESSELVQALLAAYHEETGLPKMALSTGGGTYARCLKQGVAFGSAFPDDEELAHQAGEYLSIQGLMKNVKIFVNAILRLAGE